MKLLPTADRILVRPHKRKDKTEGGIVLPDQAQERPRVGKVVAVGPGNLDVVEQLDPPFKAGQTVLYGSYAGTGLPDGYGDDVILKFEDVLAIVEE